jgi:hypothetical protein
MSTNKYFSHYDYTQTQNVVEDIIIETIKYAGIDCYYIPRSINNLDVILGEDPISSFDKKFIIEMMVEDVDGFQGDGDFISKFGLEIRDTISLIISKKRFNECAVNNKLENIKRPLEGDLIYFPFNKGLFEIKFVEHEMPFYQLGKNYIFTLKTELFTHSHEEISVIPTEEDNIFGDNEDVIDSVEDIINFIERNPTGDFNPQ